LGEISLGEMGLGEMGLGEMGQNRACNRGLILRLRTIFRALVYWAHGAVIFAISQFLQRVSIACYAERCISYDRFCPSVRPSVTRW